MCRGSDHVVWIHVGPEAEADEASCLSGFAGRPHRVRLFAVYPPAMYFGPLIGWLLQCLLKASELTIIDHQLLHFRLRIFSRFLRSCFMFQIERGQRVLALCHAIQPSRPTKASR